MDTLAQLGSNDELRASGAALAPVWSIRRLRQSRPLGSWWCQVRLHNKPRSVAIQLLIEIWPSQRVPHDT